jgi:hypothetical protein
MAYFSDLVPRNLEREFDLCVTKTTSTPISTSEDTSCPICMEDITDKNKTTTACGHVFHSSCIFQNMMLRTSCPMCREDLICKSIPSSINTNINSNTNINININYNLSQNHSLMDIDDDIINALLSEDLLSQDILSQELYYDEPLINNNDDNETVNASESESDADSESDSDAESHQELDNISSNSSVSVYDSSFALPTLADPDDNDDDDFERFETDLTLSEVTNKMIELGYTPEDMFYYMTWRVNPFYFNMQYLNKYNDDFYNTMTETMHKIFSKEIPITSNSELQYNSTPMTIDELN